MSGSSLPSVAIAGIIVGVLAFTAFLIGVLVVAARSAERAERDLRYVRHWLFLFGALYVFAAVVGVTDVGSGKSPPLSLVGLPVAGFLAWWFLRIALRMRVLPK